MLKFSSGLLNYVESVNYNGYAKTAFYTEFATNYKVGDKVFIINGNYDSDTFIQNNSYTEKTDGYTILDINSCRIVLDIDYTGLNPFEEDTIDSYIAVHHISSQQEFEYINNIQTNSYNKIYNKFEYGLTNNIIYAENNFTGSYSIYGSYSGLFNSPNFYQNASASWTCSATSLIATSSIYFKTSGTGNTYSLTNNGKLFIIGEDITIGTQLFKQRCIYSFNYSKNKWELDISSTKPYISKLNFRNGMFKGIWNDGVFGSHTEDIDWENNDGSWNSGIFFNANWKSGKMSDKTLPINNILNNNNSLYTPTFSTIIEEKFELLTINSATLSRTINYNSPANLVISNNTQNYYCHLDSNNKPIQTIDYSNNKGFGFNYIINSNVEKAEILNGNFINCNIGLTNYGINALDVYYEIDNFTYSITSNNGYFFYCDINTVAMRNTYIDNSNILNSNISNSHISSNQIKQSIISGIYNSNNGITVLNADLWGYYNTYTSNIRGVLKLFISDADFLKLNNFETIYIDRINKELYLSNFNDEEKAYIKIENKYIFDCINNTQLSNLTPTDKIVISKKTKTENKYKTYVSNSPTTNYTLNSNNYASIDIDLGNTFSWYNDGVNNISVDDLITPDTTSQLFSNIIVKNADFESGILIKSTWESGSHINDISNRIKSGSTIGDFDIQIQSITNPTELYIRFNDNTYNNYYNFKIGDYIWLENIIFIDGSLQATQSTISSTFKIISTDISPRTIAVYDIFGVLYNLNTTAGYKFTINNIKPKYISVNKFKIIDSTIKSGLFINTLILNSTIYNKNFNNFDEALTISNISQLRLINILFKDDNNILNSGLIYQSHILNTNWGNAISFNNIWLGNTFSNGLFKNGYWLNGTFNNGKFTDSDDLSPSYNIYYHDSYYRNWNNGSFNNGQFYNSVWLDGSFNNGRFFNAKWFGGNWYNGILGLKNLPYPVTNMGYYANLGTGSTATNFYNGTVESAIVGGASPIYWHNGNFNDGEFTSFTSSQSIWYNGNFNGGKFDGVAKWKNGNFNNGRFISYYGYTSSNSTASIDYSWEDGAFNNGQFGNLSTGTNSTWYKGTFNGGIFGGMVWNYGIFINGRFLGSGVTQSYRNEENFVNSFTNSYYGLWRDGYVVDSIHKGNSQEKITTQILRLTDTKKLNSNAYFENTLWLGGTFSHQNGSLNNSVWLNGTFNGGKLNNSAFNPYVDRTLNGSTSSFNFNTSCVWLNGDLYNSSFYISEWKNGTFNKGYMLGGIWRNGTWYYGTAENTYWENGTWKNGNWYGTNFDASGITTSLYVTNNKTIDILYNIANIIGTSSIHLLNAFTGSSTEILYDPNFDMEASPTFDYNGWTYSGTDWTWASTYRNIYWTYPYGNGLPHLNQPAVSVNNYKTLLIGNSSYLYGMISNGAGYTTSIFTSSSSYTITANIHISYDYSGLIPSIGAIEPTMNPIWLDIWVGNTVSNILITDVNTTINFSKTYTKQEISSWTINNTKLKIQKRDPAANTYPQEVSLLNVKVNETQIVYNNLYNNTQYTPYTSIASTSSIVQMPSLTLYSDNGTSLLYGNGMFLSGIWENGIWNNGYREDKTLLYAELFDVSSYVKITTLLHRVQLNVYNPNTYSIYNPNNKYNIGDYVSVGNLVGIDSNGNRKLLKDKYLITYISYTNNIIDTLVLEYNSVSPLVQIIKDSSNHTIFISKNIWLSGGFLNGYFNGIWNYGLFEGYPYITLMNKSHLIDGIFNGGHFKGGTLTVNSNFINSGNPITYNSGLIQNFTFYDKNIANVNNYSYQSWIDVNYYTSSQVNLNRSSTLVDVIPGSSPSLISKYSPQNLYGSPTYDILNSDSNFRDSYSVTIRNYRLGSKNNKYYNFIPNDGLFKEPFSNTSSLVDMSNFIKLGYTYSTYANTPIINSNINLNSIDILSISGSNTIGILINNNNIQTEQNRYYISEMGLQSSTAEFICYNFNFGSIVNSQIFNHATTAKTNKIEYFYNNPSINLYIENDATPLNININSLSYYEVDQIPFFQYATESNIDNTIYTPINITAPYIDYTNANYNYIGNIQSAINLSLTTNTQSVFSPGNSGNILQNLPDVSTIAIASI